MFDDAASGHDSEMEGRFGAGQRATDCVLVLCYVLRVNSCRQALKRDLRARFELTDAIELLGDKVLILLEVSSEASRLTESLGFGEVVIGPSEFRLGALPLRDIAHGSDELRRTEFGRDVLKNDMDPLDGAVWHQEPMFEVHVRAFSRGAINRLAYE